MTTAPPKPFYRPGLDVVRFIAFSLVFILHLSFLGGEATGDTQRIVRSAEIGLPLFFTLSAYLITELLLRERETTGSVHIKSFFVRRALRIWPLYFGFLFGAFAWERHFSPHAFPFRALLAYVFLAGNWWSFLHGWVPIISAMWSISVEEQFYLVWPLVTKLLDPKRVALICGAVIAVGFAWIHLGVAHHRPYGQLWTSSFTQFVFFGTGGLLALALHRREFEVPPWVRPVGLLLAGGMAIFANYRFRVIGDFPSPNGAVAAYCLMAASCVCVIVCLGGIHVPRAAKPLVYLGKISYGLYVFHLPVLLVVRAEVFARTGQTAIAVACSAILALAVTIAVAAVSYRFYETPFLTLKHRFTFVASRPD